MLPDLWECLVHLSIRFNFRTWSIAIIKTAPTEGEYKMLNDITFLSSIWFFKPKHIHFG